MSEKKKKPLFDFQHPFFEPLWIRIATFSVCFGWGLLEFLMANVFWGMLFCGAGLVAGYQFFVSYTPRREKD